MSPRYTFSVNVTSRTTWSPGVYQVPVFWWTQNIPGVVAPGLRINSSPQHNATGKSDEHIQRLPVLFHTSFPPEVICGNSRLHCIQSIYRFNFILKCYHEKHCSWGMLLPTFRGITGILEITFTTYTFYFEHTDVFYMHDVLSIEMRVGTPFFSTQTFIMFVFLLLNSIYAMRTRNVLTSQQDPTFII